MNVSMYEWMHSLLPLKRQAKLGPFLTLTKAPNIKNHSTDVKNSNIQSKVQDSLSLFTKEVA